MKLNEAMVLALINLVARVGIEAALVILRAAAKPNATLQDALDALARAAEKTAEQYRQEALEKLK